MIEIWDAQQSIWRALVDGEPQAGDLIRETLSTGQVVTRSFIPPPAPDIGVVLRRRMFELYQHAKGILDAQESWYAKGEQFLWEELEQEVAAFQADPQQKGRNLLARELAGVTAEQEAANVTLASAGLVGLVGAVTANRTLHKTAMQALATADDLAGLIDYDFTTGWPAL